MSSHWQHKHVTIDWTFKAVKENSIDKDHSSSYRSYSDLVRNILKWKSIKMNKNRSSNFKCSELAQKTTACYVRGAILHWSSQPIKHRNHLDRLDDFEIKAGLTLNWLFDWSNHPSLNDKACFTSTRVILIKWAV